MTGAEFMRKIRKLGRKRGVPVRFTARRGKGSHGTLFFGKHSTVVKHRKAEIGPGLLATMLKDLGLDLDDLN